MHSVSRVVLIAVAGVSPLAVAGLEAQAIQSAPEWRIAATPRTTIGVADGDDRYMFNEIVGAIRTRGGSIVIADGEPPLKMFDSRGTFVRPVGGRGGGPGEMGHVIDPHFPYRGDSIALWDVDSHRLSTFDSAGRFGRASVVMIPRVFWGAGMIPSESCCRMRHAYADGSVLLEFPALIPSHPGANRRATKTLARVSADGARADTIGKFEDGLYRYDANAPNHIRDIRLTGRFAYTMVGDTIIGGNAAGQWLLRIAPGARPDTIRLTDTPKRVTDALKAEYARVLGEAQRANPRRVEGRAAAVSDEEFAEFVPAYVRVQSDASGNVWLMQWKMPFSKEPTEYHVYSARGRPVARIKLPALSMIAYIAAEHVALVQGDSLGVNSLRVYDIIKTR